MPFCWDIPSQANNPDPGDSPKIKNPESWEFYILKCLQVVTHTQVVTAFLVSRKCDYLETLQYIKNVSIKFDQIIICSNQVDYKEKICSQFSNRFPHKSVLRPMVFQRPPIVEVKFRFWPWLNISSWNTVI